MLKRIAALLILFSLLASCNLPAPASPAASTQAAAPTEKGSPSAAPSPSSQEGSASPTPTLGRLPSGEALPPVTVPQPASLFQAEPATDWQPGSKPGAEVPLPADPSQAANPAILAGLTQEQVNMLAKNGFVVIQSQEAQFGEIRKVGELYGQPYYLTTDAAFHAMHLTFDELLKAAEKQNLRPRMAALLQAVLKETLASLDKAQGTGIEEDTRLAAAYLSVALKLFDPAATVDQRVSSLVDAQLAQIRAGGGQAKSALIPGFEDDYGAYKPVGHYAGDPSLESYFQGMTWFGRVNFRLKDPQNPDFQPSRAPLIVTLALRRAGRVDEWANIHTLLTFLVGPSDDGGPAEYSALMDKVYGSSAILETLENDALWQQFVSRSGELPVPQINSTFAASSQAMGDERGWRFLGQRFTLDSYILQNLIFDHVGTQENPRKLPSGLDVMASFGSQPALVALEKAGETAYANYSEQMAKLQGMVEAQSQDQWRETVFGSWLFAFLPQLTTKDASYPAYMRTTAWGFKEMNSALGSWAELKHDTVLYSKMPEFYGGGGPPSSGPAPGYVEPNPPVFYRMASLARMLSDGLEPYFGFSNKEPPSPEDFTASMDGLAGYILRIHDFAGTLQALGDIAAKELAGQALTSDEYGQIQGCLGPVECQVEYMENMNKLSGGQGPLMEMPPVPVVAAIAGAENQILEAGVGRVDRIYVVVPLEGRLEIAQGGVFAYYEFPQPRSDRLTDDQWRSRLASGQAQRPPWDSAFSLPGGSSTDATFFRIGDVYKITQAGDRLNVRQSPSTNAPVLHQLVEGDYITILDGPRQAGGKTWWKIGIALQSGELITEGWVVEDQAWYERAWGQ